MLSGLAGPHVADVGDGTAGRAWIVPRTTSGVRKKIITYPRTDPGFARDQALRRLQDRRAQAAHIVMSPSLRPRAAIPAGCGPPCT
jgi:hypothetical protein